MPTGYNHPIPKARTKTASHAQNAKRAQPRDLRSWWRGNRELVGLATESGDAFLGIEKGGSKGRLFVPQCRYEQRAYQHEIGSRANATLFRLINSDRRLAVSWPVSPVFEKVPARSSYGP
jgi:hypothetical protein